MKESCHKATAVMAAPVVFRSSITLITNQLMACVCVSQRSYKKQVRENSYGTVTDTPELLHASYLKDVYSQVREPAGWTWVGSEKESVTLSGAPLLLTPSLSTHRRSTRTKPSVWREATVRFQKPQRWRESKPTRDTSALWAHTLSETTLVPSKYSFIIFCSGFKKSRVALWCVRTQCFQSSSLSPSSCGTAGTPSWWEAWCLQSQRRQRSCSPERTPRRSAMYVYVSPAGRGGRYSQ